MKKLFKTMFLVATIILSQVNYCQSTYAQEGTTPSGIKIDNIENSIDSFMEKKIGKTAPGASIAVLKDGKVVFSKGYGYSDSDKKIKVDKNTVFEYGSISKIFVWTSAMQLVEQGKLDLDKDVRQYLSDDFNKKWKPKYKVTMRDIMNHSSGYGEYPFDIINSSKPEKEMTLEETILSYHPVQYYKPGSGSSYSNYATTLAGLVIESISGKEFYKYQKENIFDVCKMNSTAGNIAWKDNSSILERKSQGYIKKGNEFQRATWSYVPLYPAGSVNGTAEDLLSFAKVLMDDKSPIMNKKTFDKMLEKSYGENQSGTAHGLFEYDSKTSKVYGHGGNTAAFSSQFAFCPDSKFAYVVLTNAAGEFDITMGIHDLLIGNSMDSVKTHRKSLPDISNFEGSYVSMRRCVGTPLEFISYINLAKIEKTGDNMIRFKNSGFEGEYIQIEKNKFKLVKSSHPIFNVMYDNLLISKDGKGNKTLMFGKGQDFTQLQDMRKPGNLIANLVTIIFGALFFFGMFIRSIYRKMKKKEINKLEKIYSILNICGGFIAVNTVAMLAFVISYQLVKYNQILIFQIVFYIISIISILLIILGIRSWKKVNKKSDKILFVVSSIIIISLINTLALWNVFALQI